MENLKKLDVENNLNFVEISPFQKQEKKETSSTFFQQISNYLSPQRYKQEETSFSKMNNTFEETPKKKTKQNKNVNHSNENENQIEIKDENENKFFQTNFDNDFSSPEKKNENQVFDSSHHFGFEKFVFEKKDKSIYLFDFFTNLLMYQY